MHNASNTGDCMTDTTGQAKKEFFPLEDGDYLVRMQTLTEKQSKAGNNMLSAKFQIVKRVGAEDDKGIKGRIVFENFLLDHKNPKPVEIAAEKLGQYAGAVGASVNDGDYSELHDFLETPFVATLETRAGTNGYADQNQIKVYSKR